MIKYRMSFTIGKRVGSWCLKWFATFVSFPNGCWWCIATNRSCRLKTMYCNLALSPPDCRKMACVRGEELIFLAFLMKSLHQPVSNKTQWNSGDLGHCLWISQCTSFLCYYTIAAISRLHHCWIPSKECNCVSIPRDKCPVKPIDFFVQCISTRIDAVIPI